MTKILRDLDEYLRGIPGEQLLSHEMLKRLITKVETEGIDERDLILRALTTSEETELQRLYNGLEIATRDRRELQKYFDAALTQAVAQRDAYRVEEITRLQAILDNPPDSTRTIDQKTIELALEVWTIQEQHPGWSLKDVAVKHFHDIGEYDLIRKATHRVRKAVKKSKSVP